MKNDLKKAMKGARNDPMHGRKAKFTYPWFGNPDTCPGYHAHSGQEVTIIRQLNDEECDKECQPAYFILAEDGWLGSADRSELTIHHK